MGGDCLYYKHDMLVACLVSARIARGVYVAIVAGL